MRNITGKAVRINLLDLKSIQMRTFHMSWIAFHMCFFGWFGIAPLMAVVRNDLSLTQTQIGNIIIASVAITIPVRLIIGPLCDYFGPRRTYAWLLILGALPVMGIGLADDYQSFMLARLAIGAVGASFVITQYHASVMFAPNVVGTANATTAGWGNLGGGTTQIVMPLWFAAIVSLGVEEFTGWRLAMIGPGIILFVTGIAYYLFTRDAPNGDFKDLRACGELPPAGNLRASWSGFADAARDYRVWALFSAYGACFGIELTLKNIAAIYFFDKFALDLKTAGMIAGLYGLMNLFARTLGGIGSDFYARSHGLKGRIHFLFVVLLLEGLMLLLFSQMDILPLAIAGLVLLALFVQMACGATFGITPFINRRALGAVAGIVGAGGNAGAVMAGFLFRSESLDYQGALSVLGLAVVLCSFPALLVRFTPEVQREEDEVLRHALAERHAGVPERESAPVLQST